ncbi:MAG: M4 family metallopeptidase [Bacteroidia bacterium]|nr:M4 family metallopeptidase [Bacteroidia bacterium]
MRKIVTILFLVPLIIVAQNLLDHRSTPNANAKLPNVGATIIDGRTSEEPSFWSPNIFSLQNTTGTQDLNYWLRYEAKFGLPHYLQIIQPEPKVSFGVVSDTDKISLEKVVRDLPGLFAWQPNTQLKETSRTTDELGYQQLRYQQYIQGIKVRGGEWNIQMNDNVPLLARGRIYPSASIQKEGILTEQAAKDVATSYIYNQVKAYSKTSPQNIINRSEHTELWVDYEIGSSLQAKLVYIVEVRPTNLHHFTVWVDANDGSVIKVQDELCSIDGPKTGTAIDLNKQNRTVHSYQLGSTFFMLDASKSMWTNSQPSDFPSNPIGAIWTIDANNTAAESFLQVTSSDNTWSKRSAVSAHTNAGLAFDYFKNTHSRNSINGSGGTVISVVNVADDDGGNLDNAYWNGQAMFYGNGNVSFTPLAGALDVAGHELSHGVVSNTANLEYQGQSGAINESMADVFGAMIDRDDWKIGEDIVKPGVFPGGALRDLQNPHNGGVKLGDRGYQPENMSEYYTGTQDNGGVHINSGIANRAFYITANAIDKTKAEKIWYRALTTYLTSRSQFLDLRYACVDAANDLYGTTEADAVKNAFDTVQIYDPNGNTTGGGGSTGGSGTGGDIPINNGLENIISYNVDPTNTNTWYRSSTVPDSYVALTTVEPKRPCSITDDGSNMFYIGTASRLRNIELSSPYNELILGADEWNNVAISKDGSRLAAIAAAQDNKIYVYDFEGQEWSAFTLYNPTYTEGVDAGNVNYADALEWDNTGQYILYDAQNEISNNTGTNLEYWDVGIIRVWDNGSKTFGDGKVDKLFTQLPSGVSIGNASFSKNSSYIVAFDVISSSGVDVSATNTLTNTTEVIFSQDILGYPNYSNKDDKLIFDAEDNSSNKVVAVINIGVDKILPASGANASILIADAKWGKWYANGTRRLLSDKKDILSFSFPAVSFDAVAIIDGTYISVKLPKGTSTTDLVPTFTHSPASEVFVNNAIQVSGVNKQTFSSAKIYTVKAQDGSTKNYTVNVTVSNVSTVLELRAQTLIYPNPTTGRVHIVAPSPVISLTFTDINGRILPIPVEENIADITSLAEGIYFLKIRTEKGTITKKLNKQ